LNIFLAAGNRVRNIVSNAHPGGVFVLFSSSDGMIISGGKDKRLLVWDQDLNSLGMDFEVILYLKIKHFSNYVLSIAVG
jgi:WD40 repeat protein